MPQPHTESWAEFSTIHRHARSSSRPVSCHAMADSGSAYRSSAVEAANSACFSGIRARNTAPHRGFGEPTEPQYLWHLCDVPERVGDVAEVLGPAERVRARRPLLEVAHDRLRRAEEFVHQDAPWADAELAGGDHARE